MYGWRKAALSHKNYGKICPRVCRARSGQQRTEIDTKVEKRIGPSYTPFGELVDGMIVLIACMELLPRAHNNVMRRTMAGLAKLRCTLGTYAIISIYLHEICDWSLRAWFRCKLQSNPHHYYICMYADICVQVFICMYIHGGICHVKNGACQLIMR